jgi:hypothetical protein
MIREQLTHTPTPARDPGCHRRCALTHGLARHLAQTRVGRAEVVDHTTTQLPASRRVTVRVRPRVRRAKLAKRSRNVPLSRL